jgi:7,8-dihydropterin-6-yl-methyl-4-(beta-D-ribofuranosyl)aminobenzene 5'-phosphate synthase
MSELNLREADKLEITVLIDNYTDALLIQSTDIVKRPETPPPNLPLAEHGLSCLLKVYAGLEEHIVLQKPRHIYCNNRRLYPAIH